MKNLNGRSIDFVDYVLEAVRPGRLTISLTISAMAGIFFAGVVLFLRADSDSQLIQAIAPHISTLVETQDRPELMRMLSSISEKRHVDFIIVQDEQVFATSRSTTELDTLFKPPASVSIFPNFIISSSRLISSTNIERSNGPKLNTKIYIMSPLLPVLLTCLFVTFSTLILRVIFNNIYSKRLSFIVKNAISPIEELDRAVSQILNNDTDKNNMPLAPFGIVELDRIRTTILEARRELLDTTDRLAEAKAKEIVADGYRRLIHDLYTPVAALREVSKISSETPNDEELQKQLNLRSLRLAEQILNQVTTAKANLGNEPTLLLQNDIRKCVQDATEEATLAFSDRDKITVKQTLPDGPILVPHDPVVLQRAVANLVSNALRASKNTVEVEIEIEKKSNTISIRVSDDGEGIDPENITQLFQGRLPSKNGNRLGFGLPSANHIAKLHGGRLIYKKSNLGGASFEIRI